MSTTLKILPRALHDNGDSRDEYPPTLEDLKRQVHEQVAELLLWALNNQGVYLAFEKELWSRLHVVGRLVVLVFLAARDARLWALQGSGWVNLPVDGSGRQDRCSGWGVRLAVFAR